MSVFLCACHVMCYRIISDHVVSFPVSRSIPHHSNEGTCFIIRVWLLKVSVCFTRVWISELRLLYVPWAQARSRTDQTQASLQR